MITIRSHRIRRPDPRKKGSVVLTGLFFLIIMSVVVLAYLTTAVDSSQWTSQMAAERRLDATAESAIALGVNDLWGDFERQYAGQTVKLWDFRFFMDAKGIADQAGVQNPASTNLLPLVALPQTKEGTDSLAEVEIEDLTLRREDSWNQIRLFFDVTVRDRSRGNDNTSRGTLRRSLTEIYVVEAPSWDGLEYAMLANNINCLMCHTEVDNARRYYNDDPLKYGNYERVKLGSLESLHLRSAPDSWLAGTLYLAGLGLDAGGSPISNWGSISLKSRYFDGNGFLSEDTWGDLLATNLSAADPVNPVPFENLYTGYGKNGSPQVDGYLPETFPPPFPDDGGFDFLLGQPVPGNADNRVLDDSEFMSAVAGSKGTISGGLINISPPGNTVTTAGDLNNFLSANSSSLQPITDGNVYLYGTATNPIILNGSVAIDGDLIIHGHVKGQGSLKVSGNVYVPSDVVYMDGTSSLGGRTFGLGDNGTKNTLAIASGGNVMVGDIFRPEWGVGNTTNGEPSGSFNFIMDQLAIFNRGEWMKTQPTLPGQAYRQQTGTQTRWVAVWNYQYVPYTARVPIYSYSWQDNGLPQPYYRRWRVRTITGYRNVQRTRRVRVPPPTYVQRTSPTYTWVTPQITNPYYEGSNFIPRYYGFTEGSTIPIFNRSGYFEPSNNSWISNERAGGWSTRYLSYADEDNAGDPYLYDGSGNPKAVVSYLTTENRWMSDAMLNKLMQDMLSQRDATKPLQVDATLYSNNSIFGIIPGTNANGTDGQLLVNGALVAADIGLLAPKRFQLNFDAAGREVLDISSDTEIMIRRELLAPAAP